MTELTANFTKIFIDKLATDGKRVYYKDAKEKGLQLCVTEAGTKSFYMRKKIEGVSKRLLIGRYPDLTIENARRIALEMKNDIALGVNPQDKKNQRKQELTFGGLFVDYMEKHSKRNKKSWKYDEKEIDRFLSSWFGKKLSTISSNNVREMHIYIHDNHGLYMSNRMLSLIKSMFNKAIEWGWQGKNPAIGVKKFKEESRDRFVQGDEMPRLFNSLAAEPNADMRDYFYICLLTGARKTNVLAMKWKDINFDRKLWRIPETKNGETVNVPLLQQAIDILQRKRDAAKAANAVSEYVFVGTGKTGHLVEPKTAWKRILKRADIQNLRIHDLRRTMGSYQAITGASLQVIGKSLGHKSQSATAIYSRLNLDPIRESMEKAVGKMFGK